jgi:hypothetical protein
MITESRRPRCSAKAKAFAKLPRTVTAWLLRATKR